ncbi:MAG: HU family DNA-binding protein [Planctomycetota bacterium]|nr:HU family DNA-binding protein [Planctomycetota bacterium]
MPKSKTKKDIVKTIAEETGLTQQSAKELVQRTLDSIVQMLADHGRIELRNFGVFECKERKARVGRNPKTGDPVDVPAKFVVTFKPGKEMDKRIRETNPIGWNLETFELPQIDAPGPGSLDDSQPPLPPI